MYREESSIYEQNIRYHIVESPIRESRRSFFGTDFPNDSIRSRNNDSNNNNKQNETLVLAFHSSLLCFKIALCILL